MVKRELVALLNLSSYCLVIFVWLFLTVPWFSSEVCDCIISFLFSLTIFVVFAGGSCLALRVKRLSCVISSLAILSLR